VRGMGFVLQVLGGQHAVPLPEAPGIRTQSMPRVAPARTAMLGMVVKSSGFVR
jgi:hypothetical protein